MKLMVCVDDTQLSKEVFQDATRWKHADDLLYVVHAAELIQDYSILPPYMGRERLNTEIVKRGNNLINVYMKMAQEAEVQNCEGLILSCSSKSPKQALVDYATDHDIDLIFVGTRGLGFVSKLFMGSFSTYIAHTAPCNIMVVRPKDVETQMKKLDIGEDLGILTEEQAKEQECKKDKDKEEGSAGGDGGGASVEGIVKGTAEAVTGVATPKESGSERGERATLGVPLQGSPSEAEEEGDYHTE